MEQEYEISDLSPRNVRRQLSFMTPHKRKTFPTQKDTDIQNTPKGKTSKPKYQSNAQRQKVQIDFDVGTDYFLNETSSPEKLNGEECQLFADEFQDGGVKSPNAWDFDSPLLTARKSKGNLSGSNDYISVAKEAKTSRNGGESPFCKLLNESDKYSVRTYQTLDGITEQDEEDEILREKYMEEIRVTERFFKYFGDRSVNILSAFTAEPVFEIIGEERVYPLNTTLNALAKAFLRFEQGSEQVEYEYKYGYNSDGTEVILTTSGRLIGEEVQSEFIISVKIENNEHLINHVKLQIL